MSLKWKFCEDFKNATRITVAPRLLVFTGSTRVSTLRKRRNPWPMERDPTSHTEIVLTVKKSKFGYFEPFSLVSSPNLQFQDLFLTFYKSFSQLKHIWPLFWLSQCEISASKRWFQWSPTEMRFYRRIYFIEGPLILISNISMLVLIMNCIDNSKINVLYTISRVR